MNFQAGLQKLRRYVRAARWSVRALFSPMDDVVSVTPEGWPMLESWKSQPLDAWGLREAMQAAQHGPTEQRVRGALVFVHGRPKGEVVWLSDGNWTLGTAAWSSITIETTRSSERSLNLEVSERGVRAKTAWADAPMKVNGHAASNAEWVDQDEVQFEGALFYFLDLNQGLGPWVPESSPGVGPS